MYLFSNKLKNNKYKEYIDFERKYVKMDNMKEFVMDSAINNNDSFIINAIISINNNIDDDDLGSRLSEIKKLCHEHKLPTDKILNPVYSISNDRDGRVLDIKFMPFIYNVNPDTDSDYLKTVKSLLNSICSILHSQNYNIYKIPVSRSERITVFEKDYQDENQTNFELVLPYGSRYRAYLCRKEILQKRYELGSIKYKIQEYMHIMFYDVNIQDMSCTHSKFHKCIQDIMDDPNWSLSYVNGSGSITVTSTMKFDPIEFVISPARYINSVSTFFPNNLYYNNEHPLHLKLVNDHCFVFLDTVLDCKNILDFIIITRQDLMSMKFEIVYRNTNGKKSNLCFISYHMDNSFVYAECYDYDESINPDNISDIIIYENVNHQLVVNTGSLFGILVFDLCENE